MRNCPSCGNSLPENGLICPHCFNDLLIPGPILATASDTRFEQTQPRLLARVFESTTEGMIITDSAGNIIMVNPAFTRVTGYTLDEALGHNPRFLKSGEHGRAFYANMWASLKDTGRWQGEIWNRRKDGEKYLEAISISAVKNEQGQVSHYVAIFTDITARKEKEEQLHYLATHDPMTGLPNRTLFRDRLGHAVVRAQRNQRLIAVLFIDLDNFKAINDTYGHEKGDQVLKAVAQRLQGCVRQSDTIARGGGDEFTGLIEDLVNLQSAVTVADNILASLAQPFRLESREFIVTASIGISIYPIDGGTIEVLLQKADVAMYRAKAFGKNNYQFHSPW